MIRVRYYSRHDDPTPRSIPENARAVPLALYALEEGGAGAIVAMEVRSEDVKPLAAFVSGDEVCVESDDPDDVWDRENETATQNTFIWWRAIVVG